MGAKDHRPLPGPDALEQAADWVDRLSELTPAERAALDAWLRASPAHAEAFGEILHSMTDVALLAATRQVREGREAQAPPVPPPSGSSRRTPTAPGAPTGWTPRTRR